MIWRRAGKYFWESDDAYRIAAFITGGEIRYGLFAPPADPAIHESLLLPRKPLGYFDDPQRARDAAGQHRNQQPARTDRP